jgi:hypothetical protein
VLLVHGITTPCIALGAVARRLVEKGCRVMLFVSLFISYSIQLFLKYDLFLRG